MSSMQASRLVYFLFVGLTTLAALAHLRLARASGVLELEFIRLTEDLDSTNSAPGRPQAATTVDGNRPLATSSINGNNYDDTIDVDNHLNGSLPAESVAHQEAANLVRVLVCLKEPFTSRLDGPCTFGNASIALQRDFLRLAGGSASAPNSSAPSSAANNQPPNQRQPERQLNTVRISFNFRWTKAFTVILNVEDAGRAARAPNGSAPALLDRHVLTENQVLPNLEQNPNKPWTNRFSRSLKSSLAFRFRVYCSHNYFGDGCSTFCRARDDQFGHYNCTPTGQKVCLEGWQGPECERAKCRDNCNHQHGYCDKPGTCQCRPGWKGAHCDECITHPGCLNGYCLAPWQCICQPNWGGHLCQQDLNYCGTHEPCRNNGTCQNVAPGQYKCTCPEGFAGVDCDVSLAGALLPAGSLTQLSAGCALNPCLNGGTCFGFSSGAGLAADDELAVAAPGFSLDPSAAVGEPLLSERFYRCACPAGWTGDYCQWSDAASLSTTSLLGVNASSPPPAGNTRTPLANNLTALDYANKNGAENETIAAMEGNVSAPDLLAPAGPLFLTPPTTPLPAASAAQLDMRHLISGVVIASVVGVFLAALLLAWCCLVALERNGFSFIQMNFIGGSAGEPGAGGQAHVSSRLRRVQEKIRDSLRRPSSGRIKAETKLSIDNVLRPPPSYEEAKALSYIDLTAEAALQDAVGGVPKSKKATELNKHKLATHEAGFTQTGDHLVIRGALEQELASQIANAVEPALAGVKASTSSAPTQGASGNWSGPVRVSPAQMRCPKHGHIYRQKADLSDYVRLVTDQKTPALTSQMLTPPLERQADRHRNDHHQARHNHEIHFQSEYTSCLEIKHSRDQKSYSHNDHNYPPIP